MIWLKRALTLVVFGVVVYLFWPLIGELRKTADLFLHAHWGWLTAIFLLQLLSYSFLTELHLLLLSAFQGKINFWRMMAILPAMAFIEVAIPSGGTSGLVLRARLLGKSGFTPEASTFTLLLETAFLGTAMLVLSASGLWYLLNSGEFTPRHTIWLILLAMVVFILVALVLWSGAKRERALKIALRLANPWNRLAPKLHLKSVPPEEISTRVDRFYDGLAHLRHRSQIPFFGVAFIRVFLDIASLEACFLAFSYSISPGILLTGYGMMQALSVLGILPGGLGLADASLAVIYARLGAPGAVAVAAALAYRLIAYWGLRFIGFISWQILEGKS